MGAAPKAKKRKKQSKWKRYGVYFDVVYSILRVLAIVAGGGWAVNEWIEAKNDQRIRESLNFVVRFDQKPVIKAREIVSNVWFANQAAIIRLLVTDKNVAAWPDFVNKMVIDNHLMLPVQTVIDFYESLAICIAKNICDEGTARAFFARDMTIFYHQHLHYIRAMRERLHDPEIGARLEGMVNRYKA